MHKIYSTAIQVNIWLGQHTPQSVRFFEKLTALTALWETRQSEGAYFMFQGPAMGDIIKDIDIEREISDLFSRAYWTRVWTLQEVVLGRQHNLYCGSSTYSFPAIFMHFGVSTAITSYNARHSLFLSIFLAVYGQNSGIIKRSPTVPWTGGFESPLSTAMTLASSDPKDKIFGLRYIFPTLFGCIPVDYNRSIADLYTEATTNAIKATDSLDALALVTPWYRNRNLQLPSWVPDLSGSASYLQLSSHFRHHWNSSKRRKVRASTPSDEDGDSAIPLEYRKFNIIEEGKVLRVMGRKIGKVADYTDPFSKALVTRCSFLGGGEELAELSFSPDMLGCIRCLRQQVPKKENDTSVPKRVIEFLIEWEKRAPTKEDGTKSIGNRESYPLEILLAGLTEQILSVEELDTVVREGLREEDGKYWWQRESVWERVGTALPEAGNLVDPDTVESQMLLWLATNDVEFISVIVMFLMPVYGGKRIFITDSGQLGYGDVAIQDNDSIYVIDGFDMPLIARPGHGMTHELLGWAYVDGMMMREAWPDDDSLLQTIDFS